MDLLKKNPHLILRFILTFDRRLFSDSVQIKIRPKLEIRFDYNGTQHKPQNLQNGCPVILLLVNHRNKLGNVPKEVSANILPKMLETEAASKGV